MADGNEMRTASLFYASIGLAVFPLSEGTKVPIRNTNGVKDATKDPDTIARMWPDGTRRNIGIATGAKSGVFVIDVDTPFHGGEDGRDSIHEWQAEHGEFPDTVTAITPHHGVHMYYRIPDGLTIKSRGAKDQPVPGVDVKGEGGYVVAPPSVIRPGEGDPGGEYVWETEPKGWPLQ